MGKRRRRELNVKFLSDVEKRMLGLRDDSVSKPMDDSSRELALLVDGNNHCMFVPRSQLATLNRESLINILDHVYLYYDLLYQTVSYIKSLINSKVE